MGWYITLAILVLLAILPLGASVLYDEDGARVRIVAGPLKIQVFPLKKKPKKDKPKQEKPKKEKKPKAPKQPKPKKEKKPKEIDTTPPLPKKPVALIWLLVLSMLALVIVLTNLVSYSINVKDAKELFDEGDYSAAFGELEGLQIKEKDLELYNQLSTLAPIDSEWDAYVIFSSYDKKVEALDSLVCAAGRCEVNRESAALCNAEEYINKLVEKITKEAQENAKRTSNNFKNRKESKRL